MMTMRRSDRALTKQQIDDLLITAQVGRIAMAVANEPYVVPVNYLYQDGKVYFHAALKGRKLEMIRANPRVCFEVDEMIAINPGERACDYGAFFRSVIAYGNAALMADGQEKADVLSALTKRYAPHAQFALVTEEDAKRVAVIVIELTELSGKGKLKGPEE